MAIYLVSRGKNTTFMGHFINRLFANGYVSQLCNNIGFNCKLIFSACIIMFMEVLITQRYIRVCHGKYNHARSCYVYR